MRIKHKIAMVATLWLTGILLIVSVTVYFTFIRISTTNERDYLANRAEALLEKINFSDAVLGKNTDTLQSYLPDNGMIRLLNENGRILKQIESDDEITEVESKSVKSAETVLYQLADKQVIVSRIPVESNGRVIGTLEIVENMDFLKENVRILVMILTLTSLGAIGISIIGGMWLAKWILRPITAIVGTMKEIEKSLEFQKIPLVKHGGKDELHDMASTFNRMMDRIQESFIREQQFVSDASHELKTPLTIIQGYARMLQRWGLRDEINGREAVENIYSEATRMKELVEQLLNLASLQQEPELVLEPLEMVLFCENTADLFRNSYERKITIEASSKSVTCYADPAKIRQLMVILLDNAMKYSDKPIQIIISEKGSFDGKPIGIEIRVKDQGIGIPKEELSRVFERLYRVDPSRDRKTGGTGLGLAIARNIVKIHKGTIDIQSDDKSGTEVIVFIPSRDIQIDI